MNLRLIPLEDRCTPATLTGTAFHDANFNGTFDSGESPLVDVTVTLNLNGKGTTILTATTNAAGQYTFAGVANGTHTVTGTLAGYSKVTANPIGLNINTSGNVTFNLGFAPSAVVSGFAFSDTNGNGSLDTGERLLPGYLVNLDLGGTGLPDMTTYTDTNGVFRFSGVPNGTHKLTIPNATVTPGNRSITITGGGDQGGLGFAITPIGALSGTAYLDNNATGVRDAGEAPLAGVTVSFDYYNDGSIDKTITTGADGVYSFTAIPDGTHAVTAIRTGYTNTSTSTFVNTWLNGGLIPPPTPAIVSPRTPGDAVWNGPAVPTAFGLAVPAIISGFVYFDADGDGAPDAGEADLANVTVQLDTEGNGSFDRAATTDAYGRYAFTNVPNGTHALKVVPPAGKTAAPAMLLKTITLANGVASKNNAFALTAVEPEATIAVGTDSAIVNQVRIFDKTGTQMKSFAPFAEAGDTRVATGDVNGDGLDDYAVATGSNRTAQVRVIDGATGGELFKINPYGTEFRGGAFVALGDVTGDGRDDLIITPDVTGGPRVRIFSADGFTQVADFFGIDDVNFRGGARATVGDLNNDGTGDLIVSAGFGGGPRIALFDGSQLGGNGGPKFVGDFFAFEPDLRNGAFVAAGDVNGDGFADLVAGAGQGGAPRVTVFSGKALIADALTSSQANLSVKLADFFAAGQIGDRSGARVSVSDLDNDGKDDVIVAYRPVPTFVPRLAAYSGAALNPAANPASIFDLEPFPGFLGGISVG